MNKTDRKTMLNPPSDEYGDIGNVLDRSFQWCVDNIDEETAGSFFKNYIKAVDESGVAPKQFAKKNNIDFKSIFELYYYRFICPDNVSYREMTSFQDWIVAGSGIVTLCDFFGVKIKAQEFFNDLSKSSDGLYDFKMETGDPECFKEAVLRCSKKDCINFARLFSTKPEKWFEQGPDWLSNFKA